MFVLSQEIVKEFKNLAKKKVFIWFSLGLVLVSLLAGYSLGRLLSRSKCNGDKFRFINSYLECDIKFVVDKRGYAQLKTKLTNYIAQKTSTKEVSKVSIYFRDLQYGPTLGIGEYEKFSPASLLKLPLLLTYLRYSERNAGFLDRRIKAPPINVSLSQSFPPKNGVVEGKEYSISEMLMYMIKYSDNASYYTLLDYLKEISPEKDLLKEIFVDLGILDPQTFEDDTISVKSYSSIFVQLYHSSFFDNRELSEEALTFLADTDFTSGIVAGVPEGIEVAHKFGERPNLEGGLNQFHDCGIVYYPGNPYLLCVMTRGQDMSKLTGVISEVSKMVYQEFDSRKLD